jgi:hypothetical protein
MMRLPKNNHCADFKEIIENHNTKKKKKKKKILFPGERSAASPMIEKIQCNPLATDHWLVPLGSGDIFVGRWILWSGSLCCMYNIHPGHGGHFGVSAESVFSSPQKVYCPFPSTGSQSL